jgi:hypothetical protein
MILTSTSILEMKNKKDFRKTRKLSFFNCIFLQQVVGESGKLVHTGCPRVAKKLHNLLVIKDINFLFFLDDSYAFTAYSENIAVYIQVAQNYKNTKV